MRIDTYVIRPILLSLAIIGFVFQAKGYLTPWAEVPLSWGAFLFYLLPRTVFEFERNH